MSDWFELLHNSVLIEAHKQHNNNQVQPENTRGAQLLGHFLSVGLKRQGRSHHDLAKMLGIKAQVAELILEGEIPEWMLSDEFLVRAARIIGYEANILRIILDRKIAPTPLDEDELDAPASHSDSGQSSV
jgi:hypothetical protein